MTRKEKAVLLAEGWVPLDYHEKEADRWIRPGWFRDGVFRRYSQERHVLFRPPGIGIQDVCYIDLARRGCETMECVLEDRGKVLRCSFETFASRHKFLHRGHGMQCFLPLKYWRDTSAPQLDLFAPEEVMA